MQIDGVSEETDVDGTIRSHFEYFRQRDEMLHRDFGMADPTEDTSELTETMARCVPPAVHRDPACGCSG